MSPVHYNKPVAFSALHLFPTGKPCAQAEVNAGITAEALSSTLERPEYRQAIHDLDQKGIDVWIFDGHNHRQENKPDIEAVLVDKSHVNLNGATYASQYRSPEGFLLGALTAAIQPWRG
jgi:hypothetical protein